MDAGISIAGSYGPSGFCLIGNGNAQLQVYGGSSGAENMGCNSVSLTYSYYSVCFPWPISDCVDIPYPSGLMAKACLGANVDFGIVSGKDPYIRVSF